MQTQLAAFIRDTDAGQEADAILRACVHCGFCTATCPTYQLLGDELDGPRGRIYQIKQVLEGQPATATVQRHLDRCLLCRNCETTCPSGVRYGDLLHIGREVVERQVPRGFMGRVQQQAILAVLPHANRFGPLLKIGQAFKPLLPAVLSRKIPPKRKAGAWPQPRHPRRMIALDGCAQPSAAPDTNPAAARVLDRLGIALLRAPAAGCCGAAHHHTGDEPGGLVLARRNLDAWRPLIEAETGAGAEAIVMTASGCGQHVKDYGRLLAHDPDYADLAQRVSALTRDLSEILANEDLTTLEPDTTRKVAFHPPCTLQHGQKLPGVVEGILDRLGFERVTIPDAHLCCGSAGTYSLLQPKLAMRLRDERLAALATDAPDVIATANIGCQLHLETGADVPVLHWIQLLDAPYNPLEVFGVMREMEVE